MFRTKIIVLSLLAVAVIAFSDLGVGRIQPLNVYDTTYCRLDPVSCGTAYHDVVCNVWPEWCTDQSNDLSLGKLWMPEADSVEWRFPERKVNDLLSKACNANPRPSVATIEIDLSRYNQDKATFSYNLTEGFCSGR